MTNISLVAVALRAIGILIVLKPGVPVFSAFLQAVFGGNLLSFMWTFGTFAAWTAFGIVLIIWPLPAARLLTSDDTGDEYQSDWSEERFRSMAYSLVGILLLVSTFGSEWNLSKFVLDFSNDPLSTMGILFRIVVAAWLLFGAKSPRAIVHAVRRARTTKGLP